MREVLLETIDLKMIIRSHMHFFKRIQESLVSIIDNSKIKIIKIISIDKNLIPNLKIKNLINLKQVKTYLFLEDMLHNRKCRLILLHMKAYKFSKLIIKRDHHFL